MGIAKILGILLLIIVLIVGIVGVDLYMTYSTYSEVDPSTLVSDPTYDVADDNSSVSLSVTVDLPKGGFIPKGVILKTSIDFDGEVQTQEKEVELGESKVIEFTFELTSGDVQTLANGGSLTVTMSALVTPTVFGFGISQAAQEVTFPSQTISA